MFDHAASKLRCSWAGCILLLLILFSQGSDADTRIAVLDFELKDLTLAPGIPEELARTASIRPLLESELAKSGYTIIRIDAESQENADAGVGYLFEHREAAAKLGKQFSVDYVLVGRLHKPSFLFAYLMGRVIRVRDAELIADFVAEAKGPSQKLTSKTVESLAAKINALLPEN